MIVFSDLLRSHQACINKSIELNHTTGLRNCFLLSRGRNIAIVIPEFTAGTEAAVIFRKQFQAKGNLQDVSHQHTPWPPSEINTQHEYNRNAKHCF